MSNHQIQHITIEIFQATPKTRWCFLSLHASDGLVGIGEATLQRHEADVLEYADSYFPGLLCKSADPSILEAHPRDQLIQCAVTSALSQALWDIKAKSASKPLTSLLDGKPAGAVDVYANINRRTIDRTPAGFARSAKEAFDQGHRAFKIAPFDEVLRGTGEVQPASRLDNGIERIAAVREVIGTAYDLMVDCHWRLTPDLARLLIERCVSHRLYWIECPLPETEENLEEIASLRRAANAAGIRLAGCELCVGVNGFEPFLDAGAYDVVMPDIKYIGSIEDMSRLWERLHSSGVQLSPHNPSGPVSHAATLHICNALSPDIRSEMQFDETSLFWSLAPSLPKPENGKSRLPEGIGLGCDLQPEILSRYSVLRKEYA